MVRSCVFTPWKSDLNFGAPADHTSNRKQPSKSTSWWPVWTSSDVIIGAQESFQRSRKLIPFVFCSIWYIHPSASIIIATRLSQKMNNCLTFICSNCAEIMISRVCTELDVLIRLMRAGNTSYKKNTVKHKPRQSLFNLYSCKQWREPPICCLSINMTSTSTLRDWIPLCRQRCVIVARRWW